MPSPQAGIFPSGMDSLYAETGLPVVAHNRFWATDTVYSTHNGGQVAHKYFKT